MEIGEQKKDFVKIINVLFAVSFLPGITIIAGNFNLISLSKEVGSILSLTSIVLIIVWIKYLNDLWLVMGKKHGWAVGLVSFLPGGLFIMYGIAISVAYNYKKGEPFPKQLEIGFKR